MLTHRIAVVGAGPGGSAAALLLARDGHHVELFDQPAADRTPGAGILLQRLGQQVLDRLGLLDPLAAVSARVDRVDGLNRAGRAVMDFRYDDAVPGAYGLGVARGRLQAGLTAATAAKVGPTVEAAIARHEQDRGATYVVATDGTRHGPYDLVVGADGSNSALRRSSGLTRRNRPYPWGAVWALVADPDGLATDALVQRYDGTRVTLGFLPVGTGETVIFWSAPLETLDRLAAYPDRWADLVRPHAGGFAPLVDRAAAGRLLTARYWDVRVRTPVAPGLVLIGDAAHATSPQLGTGASLALADAWTLAALLRRHTDLPAALDDYARARRRHTAYYQWLSRMMTPLFQSEYDAVTPLRDRALPIAAGVPLLRRQMVTTLMGTHTSPLTHYRLPD